MLKTREERRWICNIKDHKDRKKLCVYQLAVLIYQKSIVEGNSKCMYYENMFFILFIFYSELHIKVLQKINIVQVAFTVYTEEMAART